ncbi:hypothetical protein RKD20_009242 [Streptomyces sp. SLBN-8D4]|jgi:hypothetical protein
MGLRPGGQQPAVRIECRRGRRIAYPYRIDLAKPKLPMTLAKELALDTAMAARADLPALWPPLPPLPPLRTQGQCEPCHKGYEPSPDTVMTYPAPATHRLVA